MRREELRVDKDPNVKVQGELETGTGHALRESLPSGRIMASSEPELSDLSRSENYMIKRLKRWRSSRIGTRAGI